MLVYDIEIMKAIPPVKSERRLENIVYCDGWHDHENMGVSVICAYSSRHDRFYVFAAPPCAIEPDLSGNLDEFKALVDEHLAMGVPFVGFNNINFDNRVLATLGIEIPEAASYDLLREIWQAEGLGPVYDSTTHNGYGLDAMAKAQGMFGKTGHGTLAPVQWQRGEIGSVINYCLNDVRLTWELLDRVINGHVLANPKNPNNPLELPCPNLYNPKKLR
jgi:hypothetical protein